MEGIERKELRQLRQKGKGDWGVTQMIDGRMLRQNKLSDRQSKMRGRGPPHASYRMFDD